MNTSSSSTFNPAYSCNLEHIQQLQVAFVEQAVIDPGKFFEQSILDVLQHFEPINDRLHYRRTIDLISNGEAEIKSSSSTRTRFILGVGGYSIQKLVKAGLPGQLNPSLINSIAALFDIDMTIMYHENHIRDQKFGITRKEWWNLYDKKNIKQKLKFERDAFMRRAFSQNKGLFSLIKITNRFLHDVHDLIGMLLDKKLTTINSFINNEFNLDIINKHIKSLDSYIPFLEEIEGITDIDQQNEFSLFDPKEFLKPLELSIGNKKISHIFQKRPYLELYTCRCFLLNIIPYYCYSKLIIRLQNSEVDMSEIVNFGQYFGFMQQVVNDVSDYVPVSENFVTACKFAEDTYSDMRERNVTLPMMYYFLNTANQIILKGSSDFIWAQYKDILPPELLKSDFIQKKVLKKLISSKALSNAMSFSTHITESGKNLLDKENVFTEFLNDMLKSSKGNKYYQYYNLI